MPPHATVTNDGKPPQARKRKADSGSRIGKDDIKSTDATRIKQFNIKSGLLNVKSKASKALNDITGIILNNIKKDVSNSGGTSASTNATGHKGTVNRSLTVNSNFGSRNGSQKMAARCGDQTTIIKKGQKGNASANAEKFMRSSDGQPVSIQLVNQQNTSGTHIQKVTPGQIIMKGSRQHSQNSIPSFVYGLN